MEHNFKNEAMIPNMSKEPNPKLKELTERLMGKWRVKGQGIDGEAQYREKL